MQGRSNRSERPSAASSTRSGPASRAGAGMRPPMSRSSNRPSSLRHPINHPATAAARIDRTAAPSPAESLSSITTTGTKRKERDYDLDAGEETNINVVVRCRGRNEREVRENSAVVVSTDGVKGNQVELSMGPSALSNKAYNFDRVFSHAADQSMLYDDVVKPILEEMLGGYNCTIFAYGQTGTGKTYTMSGDMSDTLGLLADAAGIIPRVLHSLFNKLDMEETESFVKCSFIELYNEELRDLIAADESVKLKIFDDTSRKGHATTIVQGMEECHIKNASEGIKLLQDGSLKRQVAATKCNDLSSRSHTVFTITACVKTTGEDGQDYVCSGKLNLVDLAGSENIQRSGAENKRAAEAGLINKSLLTLGRVINALVDRGSHIPYRESKLTRLLQDSLGGRTKTCIIATISPAKSNLEETISTLDYAFRAKNIRNKPQINQKINKKTLLKEFTHEIERLKSELIATRQKNGIYLTAERFEEVTVESESRRIQNEEQSAKIETLESNLRNKVQELFSLTSSFMGLRKDHDATKAQLDETKGILDQTDLVLKATRKSLAEETHLREAHQKTEEKMQAIGGELISTIQKTVKDVSGLHDKNRRKSDLQSMNRDLWQGTQDHVSDVTSLVESRVEAFRDEQEQLLSSISERMQSFVQGEVAKLTSAQSLLDDNLEQFARSKTDLMDQKETSKEELNESLEEIKLVRDHIKEKVGESLSAIASAAETISQDVLSELGTFHNQLHASYSSLGKDFKSIFEELLKHINSQKKESDSLRQQLEQASEAIIRSNTSISTQVQNVFNEDQKQAAEEQRILLAQIATLIKSHTGSQQLRLAHKVISIQQSLQENGTALEGSVAQYSQGMDRWNEGESRLLDELTNSRDALKNKLKDDWTVANQHSSSIQDTTKSVHAVAVQVVDEQMTDLDEQMTCLDDSVSRARSQNALHHDRQLSSVKNLASTVEGGYANIADHLSTTCSRVEELGSEMDYEMSAVQERLGPLNEDLCQPLSDLRDDMNSTVLREYQPTGGTPQKTAYEYPTELPRTEAHEALLRKLSGEPSPSKAKVFSDTDATLPKNRSPSKSFASDPTVPLSGRDHNPLSMSLRHPNLNYDPRTNATFHGFGASVGPGLIDATANEDEDITMPLPKKSRTTRSSKASKTSTSEGRENMPALSSVLPGGGREVFSQSVSRRKSPRLH